MPRLARCERDAAKWYQVLIRWKNGDETWEPLGNVKEDVPDLLKAFQKGQRRRRMLHRSQE
ncbi:hypothetical protein ASPBRDRAFT_38909 [Aspergillus brasiliensis CBS 101740]|uniref:Chromo domain-containing protein n=1 Tax=Aspergillus brasiliensis (strain CBS 101740 / IMI 381727 / IBT 21946) TaxID=767769 RepID=A0A1L9UXX3_ASPBC|nr:hypothetical protein ASPBRDRAFT_38909 [Aspergillus brasiliensis CBS 101740]